MHAEIQEPQRRWAEPLVDDVLQIEDVAERLRHLVALAARLLDHQVLDVKPEARKLSARRPLALRNLVLVMREDQVDAAGVQIDRRLAEQPQRHRRALDVPTRTPGSDPRIPRGFTSLGGFPDHEVPCVVLLVLVAVDAGAVFDARVIEPCELAVLGECRDLEIDRPIAPVGVAALFERANRLPHRLDVLGIGRARILLDDLQSQHRRIPEVGLDELIGVLAQRQPGLLRFEDRAIVDIGEVHHVTNREAGVILQRSPQDIDCHEGAKVADVAAGVGRQAARIHPHQIVARRGKGLLAASQRVEQQHRIAGRSSRVAARGARAVVSGGKRMTRLRGTARASGVDVQRAVP